MKLQRCLVTVALVLLGPLVVEAEDSPFVIDGTVTDVGGLPVPGASVELASQAAASTVTDAEGRFRLAVPAAGTYEVVVGLEGFETTRFKVEVGADPERRPHAAVTLLGPVLCDYPVIDPPKAEPVGLSQEDLRRLPLASSPWSALERAPGVLLDRVNVGGSEDGDQPTFVQVGSAPGNTSWILEGLTITDLAALAGSPTFYDAGALERVKVTSGGADAALARSGPTLDLTTLRGGTAWRGSARVLAADGDWQSGSGRLDRVSEVGVEGGGPLVSDRLFAWGAFGREEIERRSLDGFDQSTELEIASVKLDAQLSDASSATLFGHRGDKQASGRGASAIRPPEATWEQSGPAEIVKLEGTQLVGSRLFFTLAAGRVDGGFALDPQGGNDVNAVRGPDGVWRGSFLRIATERDSDELKADGGLFLGGEWAHELRFGAGWRETEARSVSNWPGQQVVGLADIELFSGLYLGFSSTENARAEEVENTNLWLDETLIHGAFTARLGLRYDLEEGNNLATTIRPAPLHPDALPGGTFGGQDGGFEWKTLSPRFALSWAPGSEPKTTVAVSYARFADQLGTAIAGLINPVRSGTLYFPWFDANGDLELTADEIGRVIDLLPGFDSRGNPLPDADSIDPELEAPTTDELALGVERRLGRYFLLGLTATWRRSRNLLERERLVEELSTGTVRTHRAGDYEPLPTPTVVVPLPDGTPARIELYRLRRDLLATGGVRLENGEREQEAKTLTLRGQLFEWNGLRASGQLSWHDWEWQVPASENEDPSPLVTGDHEDGGAVLVPSLSSGDDRSDVFLNAGWSYSLAGSYDVAAESRWGFTLGAHLRGREGYPLAYSRSFDLGDGLGARRVLVVPENDAVRLDDVHLVDLRLAKTFELGPVSAQLGLDIFNALGADTVLQRETSLSSARAGAVRETLEPRTVRLGLRLALD